MKSVGYIIILLILNISVVHALTLDELSGVYKLSTNKQIDFLGPGMTIEYKLAIDESKDEFGHNIVGVNEYIKQSITNAPPVTISQMKCWGTAQLSKSKLMTLELNCPNSKVFEQEIDFSKIEKLENGDFKAPVYNNLYYSKMEMLFEKLETTITKK